MGVNGKNTEDSKNGKESGTGSPTNGQLSEESCSASDSESENGIRTGDDYQAVIPAFDPDFDYNTRKADAMLVWGPHPELTDGQIDEYCQIAKQRYAYNTEQALGMLFWHRHRMEKAYADLANFTPFPDEWTVEDKVLFEQAFGFHGKSFQRIRQMLPDKSIGSLVKYYYSWKKTRARTSLMDRQLRVRANNGREDTDEEVSEHSDPDQEAPAAMEQTEPELRSPMRAGTKRLGDRLSHGGFKRKKPPKGMYINMDDLMGVATGPAGQGEGILRQLDTEIYTFKRQVQNLKQTISCHSLELENGIRSLEPPEAPKSVARWSNHEMQLAIQGVSKYGKNYKAIADVVGNKTDLHVRSFFVNYRQRFNLDEVYADYLRANGLEAKDEDSKLEVEDTLTEEPQPTTVVNGVPPPLKKPSVTSSPVTVSPTARPSALQQPPPLRPAAGNASKQPAPTS